MLKHHKEPEILLIQTNYVRTLLGMLSEIEPDIYPYIEQAGLPENILNTPHRYVPEVPVRNLIEIIASISSDQQYQILSWQACKNIFVPSILSKIKKARTVEQALLAFIDVMKYEAPNTLFALQDALGKTWLGRQKKKANKPEKWYELSEQLALIYMIELIRSLSNKRWQPDQISIMSESAEPFQALLNNAGMDPCTIFTDRRFTALNITDEILKSPFSAKLSWKETEHHVHQEHDFIELLKTALPAYLFAGKLPIAKAAQVIGLTVRTLQRRLQELDISYRQILDDIQMNEAKKLLADSSHAITSISTQLGYSNIAHFSRAFKRVTGEAPSVYRRNNIN